MPVRCLSPVFDIYGLGLAVNRRFPMDMMEDGGSALRMKEEWYRVFHLIQGYNVERVPIPTSLSISIAVG